MKLGCGLFGLAFEMERDMWGTMKELAEAGYTAIEPLYSFQNDPAMLPDSPIPSFLKFIMWNNEKVSEFQPRLRKMGLTISSMHVGFMFGKDVKEGCEELISFAEKSGIRHFMTSLEFDTEEKEKLAAKLLNTAEDILHGSGVTLGYHNHYMEFQPMKGASGETLMDDFLKRTKPEVKIQLDVGWQMYGGSNIIPFMEKYKDRIISVHLKDFIEDFNIIKKEDSFAAIGDGVLPTEKILELLPQLTMMEHGLMVDQDLPAKDAVLLADIKKGAEYLKRKL